MNRVRIISQGLACRRCEHLITDSSEINLLENSILKADLQTGRRLIAELAEKHGYEELIFGIFAPLLNNLGELLKNKEASLAQTYVASLMVDELLTLYEEAPHYQQKQAQPQPQESRLLKGPVVLANIEDDCHPLGRKIIAALLKFNQWNVMDLGIDVEAGIIVEQAVRVGAPVIGISAMTNTTAENILKVRHEINRRGYENRIKLAVGGAVFRMRPPLAAQVGADGTAPDAFTALTLFDELYQCAGGRKP